MPYEVVNILDVVPGRASRLDGLIPHFASDPQPEEQVKTLRPMEATGSNVVRLKDEPLRAWMPSADKDWHPLFPMPSFRQWQEITIENIIKGWASGKKYAIVEGPTGSGKSGYAITLARYFDDAFIATPQKMLQNQYMRDFEGQVFELKGKATYPCLRVNHARWTSDTGRKTKNGRGKIVTETEARNPIENVDYISLETWNALPEDHIWRKYNCSNAPCNRSHNSELKKECKNYEVCEYIKRRDHALHCAPVTLFNFANLLLFSLRMPKTYAKRPLLILDECHAIESFLYEYASILLTEKVLEPLFEVAEDPEPIERITKPFESVAQFCTYLKETLLPLFERYDLSASIQTEVLTETKEDDEFVSESSDERLRMKVLANRLKDLLEESPTEHSHVLVPKTELKKGTEQIVCVGVHVKPFSVADLGPALAFKSSSSRVLLMSATILDPETFCKSIGIPKEEAFFIRVPSTFPAENRLIIGDTSVGYMTYKHKDKTLPIMLDKIRELANKHQSHKGIIHTGNYENMRKFRKWVKSVPELSERVLFQSDDGLFEEKDRIIKLHTFTSEPTILCGPGLVEGLDLKDDLARFNILMKLPFLSLADPLIKRKSEEFPEWYDLQVALAIIQAIGRPVRSVTDWAVTYILDRIWQYFYENKKHRLFPKHIQDAVRWVSKKYPVPYV